MKNPPITGIHMEIDRRMRTEPANPIKLAVFISILAGNTQKAYKVSICLAQGDIIPPEAYY